VVRHQFLVLAFGGSNPSALAKIKDQVSRLGLLFCHARGSFFRIPELACYTNCMESFEPLKPKRSKKRLYFSTLLVVFIIIVIAYFLILKPDKTVAPDKTTSNTVKSTTDAGTIRLLATGDWIAHDSVNAAAKQANGSYNYLPLIADTKSVFSQADIKFCNDPILNGGISLGITGYPKFNSPTEFVTDMGKQGCNLANTASNHSFDYTQANIDNSVDAWAKVPNMLAVAGENKSQAQHDQVNYFTVKGVKFAYLAYTTYSNTDAPAQNNYGVNVFSKGFAASQIQQAKQNGAKIIITSMRWGTEYSTNVNAEQTADAQLLADQGVNLILGHGSHELQTVNQLTGSSGNKTMVWYSLGNFINTQEPPETLFNGIALMDFNTKTGEVSAMKYLPIYMHYEWTSAEQAADNTNARTSVKLYLLQNATQAMLDSQQLKTTIAAQKERIASTLSVDGQQIPLITSSQLKN
jgi:poly-gamma-glutamate capsule biosynthesis protein CapA/YwtB (metallophosphatase superfamily)